jgi:flagellar protein FlbD
MIQITRLDHKTVVLNSDMIVSIESTPDTVITLSNGQKLTVLDAPDDLAAKVREYRRSLWNGPPIQT